MLMSSNELLSCVLCSQCLNAIKLDIIYLYQYISCPYGSAELTALSLVYVHTHGPAKVNMINLLHPEPVCTEVLLENANPKRV